MAYTKYDEGGAYNNTPPNYTRRTQVSQERTRQNSSGQLRRVDGDVCDTRANKIIIRIIMILYIDLIVGIDFFPFAIETSGV